MNKVSVEQASAYATKCHRETNHLYDELPYEHHLRMVEAYGKQFLPLIPDDDQYIVLAACWCHDLIEDTRQTYNDVERATNTAIANIVYALTNEKGKNRKQRANDTYYRGIRHTQYATFVKLCDRLANVNHSLNTRSRMIDLYRKENTIFSCQIYNDNYREMFECLESLLTPVISE